MRATYSPRLTDRQALPQLRRMARDRKHSDAAMLLAVTAIAVALAFIGGAIGTQLAGLNDQGRSVSYYTTEGKQYLVCYDKEGAITQGDDWEECLRAYVK